MRIFLLGYALTTFEKRITPGYLNRKHKDNRTKIFIGDQLFAA